MKCNILITLFSNLLNSHCKLIKVIKYRRIQNAKYMSLIFFVDRKRFIIPLNPQMSNVGILLLFLFVAMTCFTLSNLKNMYQLRHYNNVLKLHLR